MTMFRVGDRVVCVDASSNSARLALGYPSEKLPLVEGQVYEISAINISPGSGKPRIAVKGVDEYAAQSVGYKPERFRPVATTDISWAHKLVADLPKSKTLIDS